MPRLRRASLDDLDLLVAHRRRMWEAMARFTREEHEAASRTYRRWLRPRLRSGTAAGFIVVEAPSVPVASGVVWLMDAQPRPGWAVTRQAYLMSIFTEPGARRHGHASRITRAAMRWARERRAERISLHASQEGARVYGRLGFKRTHEMRRDL